MKRFLVLCVFFCLIGLPHLKAQFDENPERKEMWRRSIRKHKAKEAFNPYLDKKQKPSQKLNKYNAREQKRQLKAAKKQKRRSMKKLGYKETKVKRAK